MCHIYAVYDFRYTPKKIVKVFKAKSLREAKKIVNDERLIVMVYSNLYAKEKRKVNDMLKNNNDDT